MDSIICNQHKLTVALITEVADKKTTSCKLSWRWYSFIYIQRPDKLKNMQTLWDFLEYQEELHIVRAAVVGKSICLVMCITKRRGVKHRSQRYSDV